MALRTINGILKAEFTDRCFAKATEIDPEWPRKLYGRDEVKPEELWLAPSPSMGFSLTSIGNVFFEKALQLSPYIIDSNVRMTSDTIVKLDKLMPWPYYVGQMGGMRYTGMVPSPNIRFSLYSSEVAVWAALYDNDILKLLEAYGRNE